MRRTKRQARSFRRLWHVCNAGSSLLALSVCGGDAGVDRRHLPLVIEPASPARVRPVRWAQFTKTLLADGFFFSALTRATRRRTSAAPTSGCPLYFEHGTRSMQAGARSRPMKRAHAIRQLPSDQARPGAL